MRAKKGKKGLEEERKENISDLISGRDKSYRPRYG